MFDLGGDLAFVNRAAVALYGFTEAETNGDVGALDDLFALYDLNDEPLPPEAYPAARLLRGESFTHLELWIERRTGGRRWLGSYSGSRVQDSRTLLVLSVRDVTAQRELETRYRATFAVNPTAMSVVRLKDLRFTEVNDSFLKLTGYRRDEVVGRTADDLRLLIENKKRDEALRNLRRGEADAVIEHEAELQTKTGERRTVLSEGRLIAFDHDLHLIDTYVDITERKRAENELSQAV